MRQTYGHQHYGSSFSCFWFQRRASRATNYSHVCHRAEPLWWHEEVSTNRVANVNNSFCSTSTTQLLLVGKSTGQVHS